MPHRRSKLLAFASFWSGTQTSYWLIPEVKYGVKSPKSLFGLHVHSCTHCMAETPYPPPAFGLIYEGAIGQTTSTTSLCNPLASTLAHHLTEQLTKKISEPSRIAISANCASYKIPINYYTARWSSFTQKMCKCNIPPTSLSSGQIKNGIKMTGTDIYTHFTVGTGKNIDRFLFNNINLSFIFF